MNTRNITFIALFIALGLVLPMAFHFLGSGLGAIFLPMHIPVFLAGIILGPAAGLLVGIITPLLSSVLTGMPPLVPMVPIMIIELAIYGWLAGYLIKERKSNIYTGLLITMISGRIGAGLVVWVLVHIFSLTYLPANPMIYVWGTITKGVPGIVVQLVIIPLLIGYLNKANFLKNDLLTMGR